MNQYRPLGVFYILVAYVFIQLGWWSYLLVELNNEVDQLKTELLFTTGDKAEIIAQKKKDLDAKLHHRWIMVLGEGSVFTLFLAMGIINTHRAFRKESELGRQQKNFLLSITHELKSPIASIKLYLQTMQKREIEKEKQQEFIRHAIHDADRLDQFVENLLLAAQMEGETFSFKKEKLDLSALVEVTIGRIASPEGKKINLRSDIEANIFYEGDRIALVSLVINLVENAMKYSPENSLVKAMLKREKDKIIFSVTDEGPGIPASEKKNIFRKFYRIGNEETRIAKGTGLGLYIVENISAKHKANIFVKDNSPRGCIFEVVFTEL